MKKISNLFLLVATMSLFSCSSKNIENGQSSEIDSTELAEIDTVKAVVVEESLSSESGLLLVDSVRIVNRVPDMTNEGDSTNYVLYFEYPMSNDNSVLADTIRNYVVNTILCSNEGKSILGEKDINKVSAFVEDVYASSFKDREEYGLEIRKVADNHNFVSFLSGGYEFPRGAAHGSYGCVGTTFLKNSLQRISWDCFKDTQSRSFKKLMVKYLKLFFSEDGKTPISDKELEEIIIEPVGVPTICPYFTAEGAVFNYGIYAIAPYCYGDPSFVVPFDEIKPFIKSEIIEALGLNK